MEIGSNRGYYTQDGVSGAVGSIGCNYGTLSSNSKSPSHDALFSHGGYFSCNGCHLQLAEYPIYMCAIC